MISTGKDGELGVPEELGQCDGMLWADDVCIATYDQCRRSDCANGGVRDVT